MKKLILALVIVGGLVGAYVWVKVNPVNLEILQGKTVKVHRGDLEVPITANGHIEPASIARIKSKASGEVVEIPKTRGEMVAKDDLIVRLDETDEQRSVERAQADLERADIAVARATISLDEAKEVGVPMAEAERDQAQARLDYAQLTFDKRKELKDISAEGIAKVLADREYKEALAQLKEAAATVKAAESKVTQANTAIKYAQKDLDSMKQNREVAQKTLDDATERRRETKVISPLDGMIIKPLIEVGEVIQSGKTSLTGGTVLMEIADISNIYAVVNVDEADIGLVRELAPEDAVPGYAATSSAPAENGKTTATAPSADDDADDGPKLEHPVELPPGVLDPGQLVEVTVESFPSETFQGVIERIAPQAEAVSAIATFKVWIRIVSENRHKLEGLLNVQAEAHFTAKSVRNALLVSYDAFQKNPDGEGFGVFVPLKEPRAGKKYEFRSCRFGVDNGIDVQVIEGLSEGEEVFTELPIQTRKEQKAEEESED